MILRKENIIEIGKRLITDTSRKPFTELKFLFSNSKVFFLLFLKVFAVLHCIDKFKIT